MSDTNPSVNLTYGSPVNQLFPTLTDAQIARFAARGRLRPVQQGEILYDGGQQSEHFFVVTAGQLEITRSSGNQDELIAIHDPGQFTGEVNMLTGRLASSAFGPASPAR